MRNSSIKITEKKRIIEVLRVLQGNVLDAQSDAIVLTIDGAGKGMEGNVARAFARRWPETWEELEEEIPYPLPLGEVFDYEPVLECPFRHILIASTLNHKDTLSESAKKGIVRTALDNVINAATNCGIKTIATVIMSGGWRLSQPSAFLAMTEGYEMTLQSCKDIAIDIYIMDQKQYEIIQSIARGMGYSRDRG
jgi:O-acetyl-ADP-ribose deacetylase (regulator of RNase III)